MEKYLKSRSNTKDDPQEYRQIVENLKNFMTYLEEKHIINSKQYLNEKDTANLIQDLLKLDLNKFDSDGKNNQLLACSPVTKSLSKARNSRFKSSRKSDQPTTMNMLQKKIPERSGSEA